MWSTSLSLLAISASDHILGLFGFDALAPLGGGGDEAEEGLGPRSREWYGGCKRWGCRSNRHSGDSGRDSDHSLPVSRPPPPAPGPPPPHGPRSKSSSLWWAVRSPSSLDTVPESLESATKPHIQYYMTA